MPKIITERAASKATTTKIIEYILDPNKCCRSENGSIIMSTYSLNDSRPYDEQFKETAERMGNNYGSLDRKYYHFKLTFHPDDAFQNGGVVTPESALKMAEDLHLKHFSDYEAVFVVQYHNDKETKNPEHLHVHMLVNATSFDHKKNKIKLSNKDLNDLRDTAFELGKAYGLDEPYWRDEVEEKIKRNTIKQKNRSQSDVYLSLGEQNIIKKYGSDYSSKSFKERYRIAIDEAKAETGCLEGFILYLKKHFNIDTKITQQGSIKYKLADRNTYTTGKALGSLYELKEVQEALSENEKRLEKELNKKIQKVKEASSTQAFEIKSRNDYELQAMVDCVALCRQCGANTAAEFKMTVNQKGAELGSLRKKLQKAESDGDVERAGELRKQENLARQEYRRYARALEHRELIEGQSYRLDGIKDPDKGSDSKPEEVILKTKEQAIKEKNKQASELRAWINQACEYVGSTKKQSNSQDFRLFAAEMEKHGCTVRITSKTLSVKHPESNQPIRTNRLGSDYSKGAIENSFAVQREDQLEGRAHKLQRASEQEKARNGNANREVEKI